MMNVRVVKLNGYEGWNVEEVMEVWVKKFEGEECVKKLIEMWEGEGVWTGCGEGDDDDVWKNMVKDVKKNGVKGGNVISWMGEEFGYVFVLME